MNCFEDKQMKLVNYKVEEVKVQTFGIPYGVRAIEAPSMWDQGIDGEGVVIAVLDTGCAKHTDLSSQIIDGKNFTNDDRANPLNYTDRNGHGTHVAGIIAARGIGLSGVAPKAKLLIVKVLDETGSGSYKQIIDGLKYAIDWRGPNSERVRVINMSLGGPFDDERLHAAIKRAVDNNIAVVVASGNEGDSDETTMEASFPGSYNEVIEIGAVDEIHKLAGFSNVNLEIDVVAPGVLIDSTYLYGQYATLSGTSMAAPHVAGALALIAQDSDERFKRFLTEPELYGQLLKNTVSLGYVKSTEGNGLVKLNVMDKVRALLQYVKENF